MIATILAMALLVDEAAARAEAEKALQSKVVAERCAGLGKLKGAREAKSVQVLARGLADPEKAVRLCAAGLLEGAPDEAGVALEALAARVRSKQEDASVRMACVKVLLKSPYQELPIRATIDCMASIEREDTHLHRFGAEVTALLDRRIGKSYGADKATVERWEGWYSDNQARMKAEDAKLRAAAAAEGSVK